MVRVLLRIRGDEVLCSDVQPNGVSFGTAIEDEFGRPFATDARILEVDMDIDEAVRLFRQPLVERYTHPISGLPETRKIGRHRYRFDPDLLAAAKRTEWRSGTARKIALTEADVVAAIVDDPLAEGKTLRERVKRG